MKKDCLLFILLLPFLLSVKFSAAQNNPGGFHLTGIVRDSAGKALPGASINIKGTAVSAITGNDGRFHVNSRFEKATIVVSMIGFVTQEKTVTPGTEAAFSLQQASSRLDDVIVIGYGTTKKSDLTGAVSQISRSVIENRPVTNALAALEGAAPGLVVTRNNGQPGQEGYNLNIRGFASLNGTNNPLVIIDGVEGDLSLLNPDDIDNISVLKDASAASIYGAKAASGVVLVTTKKGIADNKMTVALTSLNSTLNRYDLPVGLHSYEQATMTNIAQTNAGVTPSYSAQMIKWMMDPDTNIVAGNPYYDLNVAPLVMRKQSSSNNEDLTISGGNDKSTYLIGLGYYTQQGIFKLGSDGTSRFNGRLNMTNKLSSKISLDSRIAYTYSGIQAPSTNINGDYGLIYNLYTLRRLEPIWTEGTNNTKYTSLFPQNDYAILKDGGYNNTGQHSISGVFSLNDNLAKGFSLRFVYSPSLLQNNNNLFTRTIPLYYTAASTTPNAYINPTNSFAEGRTTQYTQDAQLLADYDLTVRGDHHFHLLGGGEYQYYNYYTNNVKVAGLISNDIPSINLYSATSTYTVSDNIQNNVWYSGFGRLNYNYKNLFLGQVNMRYDASSRLAPGHRGQAFPSVSAGYNIMNSDWFPKNLRVINSLKLRASWGELGNAQLGALNTNNYNYIAQLVSAGNYPFNNVINPSFYQSSLPSQSLGWETVKTSDIGLDFGLLNNRLSGSFDYFIRNNDNMLINVNWPAVLGINPPTTNGASLRTEGWEVALSWRDQVGKNFSYFINANMADNKNTITRYDGQSTISEGQNTAIQRYPVNSIFGFKADGYFQNAQEVTAGPFLDARNAPGDIRYKDLNGDGKITVGNNTVADHGDLQYLGNTSPRYQFGFNLGFQWKALDFSTFFQGVGKRTILLNQSFVIPFVQTWRQPWAVHEDYWTPDHPNARFPRLYWYNASDATQVFNGRTSTHWIQNGAYMELKNLQIGYTLPHSLLSKWKIQKVRIFMSGEDLWQINKMWFPYVNPESTNGNAGWNYPFFHTYAAGLNVVF
jgi:TonB-linked SusC/RagA family outer membrane protein